MNKEKFSIVITAIAIVIAIVFGVKWYEARNTIPSAPAVVRHATEMAAGDVDKAARAAAEAAISARKAADSSRTTANDAKATADTAEASAQDAAKSAQDSQESANQLPVSKKK